MKQPYFSIVVPTLDEEKFLPNLLSDLTKQTYKDFEVVHVDGNSEDKTVEKAEKFSDKLDLKQISTKKRGASVQRNLGGKKAQGEWIIFADADDRFKKDFLEQIRERIAKSEKSSKSFDVFGCLEAVCPSDKGKLKNNIIITSMNFTFLFTAKFKSPLIVGAMIGVRSRWFKKIQFDEKSTFGEDVFFLKDLISSGARYKLLTTPKFGYSMRRFKDDNLIKVAVGCTYREFARRYGDRHGKYDYEMQGGKKY